MSTETPAGDAGDATGPVLAPAGGTYPGSELEVPSQAEMAAIIGQQAIPFRAWVKALADTEQFEETDEEDAALSMVRAILLADTPEQVFAAMTVTSVKDLLGDKPGARTNVYEITGAKPLASTFNEGPSCFAVIQARDLAEGTQVTLSCGARAVQAAIAAHMYQGWMPMKAVFVRRLKPTRNGFYPVNLESGI